MATYYNENEPYAAAWLRNLIRAGHLPPGEVDERSIGDVRAADLAVFRQCHFFAGIGVWPYALRLAGWPDDRPVWTGSCPCQPFSAAGQGAGFDDPRHLWPTWAGLVRECRPELLLGEQVASPAGLAWFDLVSADLEAAGYACGAADLCAPGVGAPHTRQRLFWVGLALGAGLEGHHRHGDHRGRDGAEPRLPDATGACGGLAEPGVERRQGQRLRLQPGQPRPAGAKAGRSLEAGGLADAGGRQFPQQEWSPEERDGARPDGQHPARGSGWTCQNDRFWDAADWLLCRDGRWRPVMPGTLPLAHGTAARVGKLRAYGNALVAPLARVFVEVVMDELAGP